MNLLPSYGKYCWHAVERKIMQDLSPQIRSAIAVPILAAALGHRPREHQLSRALQAALDCQTLDDFVRRVALAALSDELEMLARKTTLIEAKLIAYDGSERSATSSPAETAMPQAEPDLSLVKEHFPFHVRSTLKVILGLLKRVKRRAGAA
jgi:hypothetical protein